MARNSNAERAREFGRAVAEMRSSMRQLLGEKLRLLDLDLSFELLEILALLWRRDGLNHQDIAATIVKDKSSTTYLIDSLAKRGLVTRRADSEDRRNKRIYLTPKGRALEGEINPWVLEAYSKATTGLRAADIEMALSVIERMIENIRQHKERTKTPES